MSYITHKGLLVFEWLAFTVAIIFLPVIPQQRSFEVFGPTGPTTLTDTTWASILGVVRDGCLHCGSTSDGLVSSISAMSILLLLYFFISTALYRKYRRIHG